MTKEVKYDLFLIDILDFFYLTYSDVLINPERYKSYKTYSPTIAYTIILDFLDNLQSSNSPDSKFFFYINKNNIRDTNLNTLKSILSKRERNIDQSFDYFFNILIEILKSYKDTYYIYYNNKKLTDSIVSYNKDRNILLVSSKFDKCYLLVGNNNFYWYNHTTIYNEDSFYSTYKFTPTDSKLYFYSIITKKPTYSNKMYKHYKITPDEVISLLNEFTSFDDMVDNYVKRVDEVMSKKIYSWMKIFLINKQMLKNSDYSLFDLDLSHIFKSEKNLRVINLWRKVLKL
jgi:hypothetical protein